MREERRGDGAMWRRGERWLACAVIVCCSLVGGCGEGNAAKPQAAGAAPIEKTVERGPVHMTVRVDRGKTTIAEKVALTIQVVADNGVEVEMPSFGEKLNEFEIRDFHKRSAVPVARKSGGSTGEARSWTQEYLLETFVSGEQEIPAITARFHDKRDPAKPVDGELSSEPFKIEVTSLLAGEFDPAKFRDIKGPVELPVEHKFGWIWWTAGGGAAVVVLAIVIWLLLRRRGRAAVPVLTPSHEWAFFALQRLEEDRLIDAGRVQEFYFRLSGIVREYIERRFGMMAPERTTPEFLAEVRANPVLRLEHQGLLGKFLQAADMVKFARYEPAAGEVSDALGTARAFVEQTSPGAANAESPAGDANSSDAFVSLEREDTH